MYTEYLVVNHCGQAAGRNKQPKHYRSAAIIRLHTHCLAANVPSDEPAQAAAADSAWRL